MNPSGMGMSQPMRDFRPLHAEPSISLATKPVQSVNEVEEFSLAEGED